MIQDGEEFCPVCKTREAARITPSNWSDFGYSYIRCLQCGMGRISGGERCNGDLYDENYFRGGGDRAGYLDYVSDERWHRHTARVRLRRIASTGITSGTVVDVGSAVGFFLTEARNSGFDAVGVEVSSWAADRARSHGHRVASSMSELDDLVGQVDVVTMFQVLEHMPSPGAAIAQARRLLRPGGVLVCETWDLSSRTARWAGAKWQQLSPPSVRWLFEPHSMRRLVMSHGLEPVAWAPSPKVVSLATVVGQTFPQIPGTATVSRALSVVPVPYFLDDLITFIARVPQNQ